MRANKNFLVLNKISCMFALIVVLMLSIRVIC
jgi:hypothetical protein